jgi:hypothetical protein
MATWESGASRAVDASIEFRLDDMARFYDEEVLETGWWPTILQLEKGSIEELVNGAFERGFGILVPPEYDDELRALTADQVVVVYAQRDLLLELNRNRDAFSSVVAMEVGNVTPDALVPKNLLPFGTFSPITVPDGTIITAVIDNGIGFAHELFRLQDNTTRVQAAWIMDAAPPDANSYKGRRFDADDINLLLAQNTHAGQVDEDAVYRAAGVLDYRTPGFKPLSQQLSHGTHVMGLAAGQWPEAADETRPIICVGLPTDQVMSVGGTHLMPDIGHALLYIFFQANRFRYENAPGKRPPVVVNFSFGNFAGPHDGTGPIAAMLDQFFPKQHTPRRRLVLPAGNGNLSRCHATIPFADGSMVERLDWRAQPDDRTSSHVQLWMPYRAKPDDENLVEVTLTTPAGETSDPVGATFGQVECLHDDAGRTIAKLHYGKRRQQTQRGLIEICIAPNFSVDGVPGLAPAGLWIIEITKKDIAEGEKVEVWIERDETLPGFPQFGRQSYLDNACYQRFDSRDELRDSDPPGDTCIVRRAGLLSGFACGDSPCVIAGYINNCVGEIAPYSAAGPTTPVRDTGQVFRCGPDAAMRSDDSWMLPGVLSAGSRSGSLMAMNGTSVAAPQAAFWIAGNIAAGNEGDRQDVWDDGQAGNGRFPGSIPSSERAGGGRMAPPRFLNKVPRGHEYC